jgi:hypothetical protein
MTSTNNLNVTEVKQTAAEVARDISPDLRVVGVVLSASGSDYVEVIVTIEGCSQPDTCRIAVGVRRTQPMSALRKEFMSRLSEHYQTHRGNP